MSPFHHHPHRAGRIVAATGSARPDPASTACHHRGPSAFTLLEVLIAVATFAIVLAAINTVFFGALQLRNKTTRSIEQSLPIQQAVAIIKRDLDGIVPPGGTLAGAFQSHPGAATGTLEGLQGNALETGPEIYTNTGIVDATSPWADVQKVSYFLRDPTNDVAGPGKDLIRAVTRNLLPTLQELPAEERLMGGVERLAFLFYTGTEWLDSWDSTTAETALPRAIKVQIQMAEAADAGPATRRPEPRPPIEWVVPILVEARTNQTQNTGTGR